MVVDFLSTTTNLNDTINGTSALACFCCCNTTWAAGNDFKIEKRDMLQVGCLVRVRISDNVPQDRQNINECYLVTQIEYTEPCQQFNVRLQRNFSSTAVGDYRDDGEVFNFFGDHMRRLGQLLRCATGLSL